MLASFLPKSALALPQIAAKSLAHMRDEQSI
jgi:hypothetical protein